MCCTFVIEAIKPKNFNFFFFVLGLVKTCKIAETVSSC